MVTMVLTISLPLTKDPGENRLTHPHCPSLKHAWTKQRKADIKVENFLKKGLTRKEPRILGHAMFGPCMSANLTHT